MVALNKGQLLSHSIRFSCTTNGTNSSDTEMALTVQNKVDLLYIAKDNWILAESNGYAYQRAFEQAKQWGDWLEIATIISAFLTTVSVFAKEPWLTVLVGALTTALASADKLFLPSEKYQKHWNCRTELAGVQRNLANFALTLDAMRDIPEGTKPLDQMSEKILAIIRDNPVVLKGEDRQSANSTFASANLARMIAQAETAAGLASTAAEESLVDLPEDAPAVVAAYRTRKGA